MLLPTIVKANRRRFPSLDLVKIMAAPLQVALGSRRGCFNLLLALSVGAFLLAANLRAEFLYVAAPMET
jgi:hypothetical protein